MALEPYVAITKPTVGTGVSKDEFGDLIINLLTRLHQLEIRPIYIPLNDATPLVAGAKAYWFVDEDYPTGSTILTAKAACVDGSTSGAVVLTLKNGSTSILSTNITMSQNKTNSLDDTPAVISIPGIAYGDLIEVSVVSEGTGVTYCGVSIRVQPSLI